MSYIESAAADKSIPFIAAAVKPEFGADEQEIGADAEPFAKPDDAPSVACGSQDHPDVGNQASANNSTEEAPLVCRQHLCRFA